MNDNDLKSEDVMEFVVKLLTVVGLFIMANSGPGNFQWACCVLGLVLTIYWVCRIGE